MTAALPVGIASRVRPPVVAAAGPAAAFAWDEFFAGRIRNRHTRAAYLRAVNRFLKRIGEDGVGLRDVMPGHVGAHLDGLALSAASRKVELAALRGFFDVLVLRHAILLNPAHSVRGDRVGTVEGTTPEIAPPQARLLIESIGTTTLLGHRDRAVVACLAMTGARAGAVASLVRGSLRPEGTHHRLRFLEKNGKRRDVPVRADLETILFAYLDAAGLRDADAGTPLFRTADGRSGRLTDRGLSGVDVCRLVKRRLAAAGLPTHLSPHGFRVGVATDLLKQSTPLEQVQYLLGHSDPRTTRLYDRRHQEVTRNLVERLSL